MKKGFTLIELLVVVLIIGILSSIALPQYMKAVEKARASEAIQLLGDLANAEQIYHMSTGSFTRDLDMLDVEIPNISGTSQTAYTKNFKIETVAADGSSVYAKATRWKDNAAASGDQQYAIQIEVKANGTIRRCCKKNPTGTSFSACSAATDSTMCKAIANNACGTIN